MAEIQIAGVLPGMWAKALRALLTSSASVPLANM